RFHLAAVLAALGAGCSGPAAVTPAPVPAPRPAPSAVSSTTASASPEAQTHVALGNAENRWGERGDGSLGFRGPSFTDVKGSADAVRVSAGFTHVCAVRSGGHVVCWGNDERGQVSGTAEGSFAASADPVQGLP